MTKATVILQAPISKSATKLNKYTLLSSIREYCLKKNEPLKVENYEVSHIKNIDTLFLQKSGFRRQLKDLTLKVLQQVLTILQEKELATKTGLRKDNGTRTGIPFVEEEQKSKISVEVTEKEVRVLYDEDLETLLEKDDVELKGFLLSISMPSEARLQQRLSKNQISELEELISSASVRDISFSFFENKYSNKIKGIRRDLYTKAIAENCVKIQHIEHTVLYLLPFKNVNPFIESIEKLNIELEVLKEEIAQAQQILENNLSLQNILKKYDIKIKQVNLSGWKIYYQLDPIKIDKNTVKEMLSDQAITKYVSQLEERNKQILSSLENELLKKLKLLLTKLGRKFSGDGLHYRALDTELKLLQNKSDSVGMTNLSTLTHTLRTFLEHTQEKKQSSLEACAQEISRLVRMPKAEKPRTTIELGLNKLNGIVDARISSLQRKMIQEDTQ